MPVFASLLRPTKRDLRARLRALDMSQAIIEFATDGTIITANDRFLETMGYALADIVGRHHSMFVDPTTGKARSTGNSGRRWQAARTNPPSISASARVGARYGFRHPIIPCSAVAAKR